MVATSVEERVFALKKIKTPFSGHEVQSFSAIQRVYKTTILIFQDLTVNRLFLKGNKISWGLYNAFD